MLSPHQRISREIFAYIIHENMFQRHQTLEEEFLRRVRHQKSISCYLAEGNEKFFVSHSCTVVVMGIVEIDIVARIF